MGKQLIRPKSKSKILLADFDPEFCDGRIKEETVAETEKLQEKLITLQEMMYAQGKYGLLVVFQAMDAGGKDGTIKKVFSGVNPQGVRISSFKAPSAEELSHDFLWRIHQQVPPKGYIGVFNRSHYEDVLIVRVNNLVPEKIWRARYEHINSFEKMLVDSNVVVLKFFLHISKAEQKERLQARLDDPTKHWKFSMGDLPVREQWDAYMEAYQDAISYCNTDAAPWHIVPANRKWYRNYIILKTIVDSLEQLPLAYPPEEAGLADVIIPD